LRGARHHGGGAHRLDPAEFRRLVDEAKAQHNISDVVALDRKVTKAGRERVALCAFHHEKTPSMQVNDAKGTYHCFGCGASGDIVRYVMETKRVPFREALQFLGAADLPAVDPAQRAKALEEDEAERAAAIAEAQAIWNDGRPASGSPAEVYLRSRGITMTIPISIRFARVYSWKDADTGEIGPALPALIGAVTTGDEITGLQRIFLRDGGRAKATMKKPKKSLGRIRGGALRLDHDIARDLHLDEGLLPVTSPLREVIITEGPEDALSLARHGDDAGNHLPARDPQHRDCRAE
jgi:DNA primase